MLQTLLYWRVFKPAIVSFVAVACCGLGAGCSRAESVKDVIPAETAAPAERRPKVSVDELAIKVDPYCAMSMEHHGIADVYTYKSKKYGFCSSYCKDEFAKDPEKYLEKLANPAAAKQ